MKRFMLTILIFAAVYVYSEDIKIKVDDQWIKSIETKRDVFYEKAEIYDIVEYDRDLLEGLRGESIDFSEYEQEISILLYKIMLDNNKYDVDNILIGYDVLIYKFSDKNYFFKFAQNISNTKKADNFKIVAKTLEGLTVLLNADHQKGVFDILGLISNKLNRYIYKDKENESKTTISYLMKFLLKYMTLVDEKTIQDKNRKKVIELCDKLQLDQKVSDFEELPNGQELKQAFFFYKELED